MRIFAGILLLAASTAAIAQLATGQSGSSTQSYSNGPEVWDDLAEFGKCYASMERKDALVLVATRPGSMEELQTYKRLFRKPYQSCLADVTSLTVSPFMVRGTIAEGLYHKRIPVPAALAVTVPPSRDQVQNLGDAAICYAARHREATQSLVDGTRPGSKKEADAIAAMSGGFSECIPPNAKKTLALDTTLIRFRLAEALWRLGILPGMPRAAE
jgi:hypothetical protein